MAGHGSGSVSRAGGHGAGAAQSSSSRGQPGQAVTGHPVRSRSNLHNSPLHRGLFGTRRVVGLKPANPGAAITQAVKNSPRVQLTGVTPHVRVNHTGLPPGVPYRRSGPTAPR